MQKIVAPPLHADVLDRLRKAERIVQGVQQ
jgi:hypothetical protein